MKNETVEYPYIWTGSNELSHYEEVLEYLNGNNPNKFIIYPTQCQIIWNSLTNKYRVFSYGHEKE